MGQRLDEFRGIAAHVVELAPILGGIVRANPPHGVAQLGIVRSDGEGDVAVTNFLHARHGVRFSPG